MADEEVVIDDAVPVFEDIPITFNPRTVNVSSEEDVQIDDAASTTTEVQTKRRGRPKGSKNRVKDGFQIPDMNTGVKDKLGKELSVKTQVIMKGVTSVPSIWRPHFQMTDIEAQNIADPLSAYLIRQAEISPAVEAFIENFDVAAFVVGVSGYTIRVVKDDIEYRKSDEPRQKSNRERRIQVEGTDEAPQFRRQAENGSANDGTGINAGEDGQPVSAPIIGQV